MKKREFILIVENHIDRLREEIDKYIKRHDQLLKEQGERINKFEKEFTEFRNTGIEVTMTGCYPEEPIIPEAMTEAPKRYNPETDRKRLIEMCTEYNRTDPFISYLKGLLRFIAGYNVPVFDLWLDGEIEESTGRTYGCDAFKCCTLEIQDAYMAMIQHKYNEK